MLITAWDKRIGWQNADFAILGVPEVPVYLLRASDGWVLIEGGISATAPLVLKQLLECVKDLRSISHWFITHSHYDHCGLVPFILPHLPNAELFASAKTASAFQSVAARRVISDLNGMICGNYLSSAQCAADIEAGPDLDAVRPTVLADGETLEVDGRHRVLMMNTPGHSRCSSALLWQAQDILFVSDALGEFVKPDEWLPLVFDSVEQYRASLAKLSSVQPRCVALGHHGLLYGTLAQRAVPGASDSLDAVTDMAMRATGSDVALTDLARSLTMRYLGNSQSFVPADLHASSMNRMVRLLSEQATEPQA